jgi:hypothetical protein
MPSYTAGDLSSFTTTQVTSLLQMTATGGDHHDYLPASALGTLGFDIGATVTAVTLPPDFKTALALATGGQSIPPYLFLPRASAYLGLPFGIDLGASYFPSFLIQGVSLLGFQAKWAILKGGAWKFALAIKASANFNYMWFIHTKTFTAEVLASYNLYVVEPTIGVSGQYWLGDLNVPLGSGLSVSGSANGFVPHIYAGLPMKFFFIRIGAEIDYYFNGMITYGAKLSFGI